MTAKRSRAREAALQLLFERDLHPDSRREDVVRFARQELVDETLEQWALDLLDGAVEHQAAIDDGLARAAENCPLARMAVIDRNILRLGARELTRADDVPAGVIISEAIELAKKFGSADSPAFVNGVLDRFYKERRKTAP